MDYKTACHVNTGGHVKQSPSLAALVFGDEKKKKPLKPNTVEAGPSKATLEIVLPVDYRWHLEDHFKGIPNNKKLEEMLMWSQKMVEKIYADDPCPKALTKEEWEKQQLESVWNIAADLKNGAWDLMEMTPLFIQWGAYFANVMPRVAWAALGYEAMVMVSLNIMKECNKFEELADLLKEQLKKASKVIGELVSDYELYQRESTRSESYLTIMAEAKRIQEAVTEIFSDTKEVDVGEILHVEKIPESGLQINSETQDSLFLTQYDGNKREREPTELPDWEDMMQAQLKGEEKKEELENVESDTKSVDNAKGIMDGTIEPRAPKKDKEELPSVKLDKGKAKNIVEVSNDSQSERNEKEKSNLELDVATIFGESASRTLNFDKDSEAVAGVLAMFTKEMQAELKKNKEELEELRKTREELEEVKKSREEIRADLEALRRSFKSADYTPSEENTLPWLAWVNRLQDREAMVSKAQHQLKNLAATSNVVSEHVHDSLEKFEKYIGKGGHERTEVTIWGDVCEMMDRTNFNRAGKTNDIDWTLEIEEGWVPYNTFSSEMKEHERKVISTCDPPPKLLKEICIICQYHFGPEGAYTLGQCGHNFHATCLSKCALTKSTCPVCRSPITTRFYEVMGTRDLMPPGHEFNRWNLPLDQLPKKFHNHLQWGKTLEWSSSSLSHNLIIDTDVDKDPLDWMTRDYEVELRARNIDDSEQREVFCRNFGGHWNESHKRFFRFPPKRVEKREDGSYHEITIDSELHKSYNTYNHTLIGRALVLAKLEEAAKLQDAVKEESFADSDITYWDAVAIYVKHIDDAITHWRTSLQNPTPELLVSITAEESLVKKVVAQIESAMEVFRCKEDPGKKRKRVDGNESDDSWMSGHRREIAAVDREYVEGGRIARPSQRPRTRSIAQAIDTGDRT